MEKLLPLPVSVPVPAGDCFGSGKKPRFALGSGYSQVLWRWTQPQCCWELLQRHLGKYFGWFHCSFCIHSCFLVFGFVFFACNLEYAKQGLISEQEEDPEE